MARYSTCAMLFELLTTDYGVVGFLPLFFVVTIEEKARPHDLSANWPYLGQVEVKIFQVKQAIGIALYSSNMRRAN